MKVNKNLSRSGKINGNYKDGRTLKLYFCDCGRKINWRTAIYGSRKCHSCGNIKINRITRNYCCMDCGNLIIRESACYGSGRCRKCSTGFVWHNINDRVKIGLKISNSKLGKQLGENNPNYIDGRTSKTRQLRNSKRYSIWRNKIFEKDNFTCQSCSQYGNKLIAHHIESYHWCDSLRFNIYNGVTLCEKCHNNYHRIYSNFWNNSTQYLEFIGVVK